MNFKKYKWVILLGLILTYPIVIGSFWLNSITYPLLLVYIPIFIYDFLPNKKPRLKIALTIIGFIIYIIITFIPLLRQLLCAYGRTSTEYVNKNNPNLKVIGRDFSCYGTTNDLVLYKQYTVLKYVNFEIYYKTTPEDYNTGPMDTTIWKKVSPNDY